MIDEDVTVGACTTVSIVPTQGIEKVRLSVHAKLGLRTWLIHGSIRILFHGYATIVIRMPPGIFHCSIPAPGHGSPQVGSVLTFRIMGIKSKGVEGLGIASRIQIETIDSTVDDLKLQADLFHPAVLQMHEDTGHGQANHQANNDQNHCKLCQGATSLPPGLAHDATLTVHAPTSCTVSPAIFHPPGVYSRMGDQANMK